MQIKKLFKFRYYWMGIAMLWIMFFHLKIECNGFMGSIKRFGYGGVDIFLFASGVGNYYSYLKEETPLVFLKRKLKRLAPAYIPFICIWLGYCYCLGNLDGKMVIGNLLGIGGLSSLGSIFNWYITALLLMYILTPYLATFVKESSFQKNLILLCVLIGSSVVFWDNSTLIITFTRIPIYFIGMMLAKYDEKVLDLKLSVITVLLAILGLAALEVFYSRFNNYLWNYGLNWYPFICITPCLCMITSLTVHFINQYRFLRIPFTPILNLIEVIGKCSFEVYLVHIFLFQIGKDFQEYITMPFSTFNCLLALLSIVCAVLFHRMISRFSTVLSRMLHKKA